MADIRPFRGVRFNTVRFGHDISGLVCPPFDVISPAQQGQLYERDLHNVIRLELPREDPTRSDDKYVQAASQYSAWLKEGVLVQDETPALYLYRCRFSVGRVPRERHGLIAALKLEPWERRVVLPHERVLPGPIEDRIQLMRACRTNFSPIWGLYRDQIGATEALWAQTAGREPDLRAVDGEGAEHAVWRCVDWGALTTFHRALSDQPVYIADGHHRYTTALQFREEAGAGDPNAAANFVMAHLVRSEDPGLPVTGIHRIIRTEGVVDATRVREMLSQWFEVEDHTGDAASLLARLQGPERKWPFDVGGQSPSRPPRFGIYSPRLRMMALARLKVDAVPLEFAGDHSEAWRSLDAAALHTLGIDHIFPGGTQALLASGRLSYAYSVAEVERVFELGASPQTPGELGASPQTPGETSRGDLALFLAGTPVDQVLAVADAQDRMPEKSTYFYPKPVTGTVLASLVGEVPAPGANL